MFPYPKSSDCCCGCPKFSDHFDRADSTDLGSNWTENNGSWSIVSNKLALVAGAAGDEIALMTTGPTWTYANRGASVKAKVKSDTDGDEIGIISVWTGPTDFMWATLTVGEAPVLRLGAAATTWGTCSSGFSAPVDQEHLLQLSIEPTSSSSILEADYVVSVRLNGELLLASNIIIAIGDGEKFGVICKSLNGNPTWDDFYVEELDNSDRGEESTCPTVNKCCWILEDNQQLRLIISGMVDRICIDCEALDGTYILDRIAVEDADIECDRYELTVAGSCDTARVVAVVGNAQPASYTNCNVLVQFLRANGTVVAGFEMGRVEGDEWCEPPDFPVENGVPLCNAGFLTATLEAI